MPKNNTMLCVVCTSDYEGHKKQTKVGDPPKIKHALYIYSGTSVCKQHLFMIVQAMEEQQKSRISVPRVDLK